MVILKWFITNWKATFIMLMLLSICGLGYLFREEQLQHEQTKTKLDVAVSTIEDVKTRIDGIGKNLTQLQSDTREIEKSFIHRKEYIDSFNTRVLNEINGLGLDIKNPVDRAKVETKIYNDDFDSIIGRISCESGDTTKCES